MRNERESSSSVRAGMLAAILLAGITSAGDTVAGEGRVVQDAGRSRVVDDAALADEASGGDWLRTGGPTASSASAPSPRSTTPPWAVWRRTGSSSSNRPRARFHASRGERRSLLHRQHERRPRRRRGLRQAAVGVRPGGACRGRPAAGRLGSQPRHRVLEGQGVHRHVGRAAVRDRRTIGKRDLARQHGGPPTRRSTSRARRRSSRARC